jgi:hypothetical protein
MNSDRFKVNVDLPGISDVGKEINLRQISLIYENGAISWIRHGKPEIVRMIYPAVRDRNYTDASYKTYSTPLEIPIPREM